MKGIQAFGSIGKVETSVIAYIENGKLVFKTADNYKRAASDKMLRTLYEHYYERIRPIAGTYYPPKNSLLSARCVFEDGMFRKLTKIVEHEPVEKIPYTAGVIY